MIGLTKQEQVEFERIKDEMWNYGYETAKEEFGWHPSTKQPKEGDEVMVIQTGSTTAYRAVFIDGIYYSVIVGKKAYYPSVEWWCCPPEKED